MRFRRQSNVEEGVNLTPLIDVVFLLLIFFMVSTTFTKETHLTLTLPEASGEERVSKVDYLEVVVAADGGYAINGNTLVNKHIDTLMKGLQEVAGDARDIPLVITGDAKAPYQSLVTAMDAAGQLGFVDFNLTKKNPTTESP